MTASFIARLRACRAAKAPWAIDADYVGRIAAFLRRRHRYEPALAVARDTGLAEATVKNWLQSRNGMNAGHLLVLVDVYGVEVLAAAYGDAAPAWLTGAAEAAEAEELRATQERIAERLKELEGT